MVEARKQVAVAIADEKRLAKQQEQERALAVEWEKKAMLAVKANNDDLAKQALQRKGEHAGQGAETDRGDKQDAEDDLRHRAHAGQQNARDPVDDGVGRGVRRGEQGQRQRNDHRQRGGLYAQRARQLVDRAFFFFDVLLGLFDCFGRNDGVVVARLLRVIAHVLRPRRMKAEG